MRGGEARSPCGEIPFFGLALLPPFLAEPFRSNASLEGVRVRGRVCGRVWGRVWGRVRVGLGLGLRLRLRLGSGLGLGLTLTLTLTLEERGVGERFVTFFAEPFRSSASFEGELEGERFWMKSSAFTWFGFGL